VGAVVKLAMTLLVRDEADIVEAQLAFHLAAGVDVVIATDHRSSDGTTEILERYARDGSVHLVREDAERIRQSDWVTRMARLAATEHGADWVLNSDADEFWWPRAGTLKDVLGAVPPPYGVVRAVSRIFVPRPGRTPWAERMTARLALAAPINDPATPYRHVAKVAHRAHPQIVVRQGNHSVAGVELRELRPWAGLELLHFPLRSQEQVERKHRNTLAAWERNLRGDLARSRAGSAEAFHTRVVVDDDALARGLSSGALVEDTRLRDALREPRVDPRATACDDVSRAVDVAVLDEADAVRLHRRLDELAVRVGRYGVARRW
jgi:hypothetical protein